MVVNTMVPEAVDGEQKLTGLLVIVGLLVPSRSPTEGLKRRNLLFDEVHHSPHVVPRHVSSRIRNKSKIVWLSLLIAQHWGAACERE